MSSADAGLNNLRRFIANLTAAAAGLPKVGELVQATGRSFDELEKEAVTEGDGLNSHLDQVGDALESGQKDVRQGLTDLTQAATTAQATVAEANTKLEEAATDLESRAQTASSELDTAHTSLTDQGFKALDQVLETAEQQLETEKQEAQQAFDELETTVKGFETEAQTSWDEAETALEQAATDLTEEESGLEAAATEGTQGFQAAGTELESKCDSLEGELVSIYDAFASGVESQGQEWDQALQKAVQEAVSFVESGQQERLDQPAGLVQDEALAALTQEYTALGAVLDSAAQVAGELEPLAGELQKCGGVCDVVGRLLGAMAG
jgi:F0F1-type ATP synthase membrane subunit b/b'